MERGNIIIIEGPQGSGKSTMANFLRDNLACSNLYRLTGIKDKTITGYEKNKKMYFNLIDYMASLEETGLNLIFDRTFFTEQVYASLGYKDYKFDDVYEELVKRLAKLNFNIFFVVLYCDNTHLYEERLKRQHHNYQSFSLDNSVNQQNMYIKLIDEIKEENINKIKLCVDNFDKAYSTLIEEIPVLKENIEYKKNV